MTSILSLLCAILLLGVLILVHEWGHFLMGRALGFTILEFAVGFGPKLFSFTKKDTCYSLRLLPLGGYCMFDGEEKGEETRPGSMYNQKPWKRLLVMLSGCFMNFLTAFVLAMILLTLVGLPMTNHSIGSLSEGGAAQQAGLLPGDEIVAVNGVETPNAEDVVREISAAMGQESTFRILRDGQSRDFSFAPVFDENEQRYMIGIYFGTSRVRINFFKSLGISATYCVDVTKALFSFLGNLLFKGEGASDLTGPIGTVYVISQSTQQGFADSFAAGLDALLELGILISMNLGILNILPLPALDGGKVVFVLIEMIFRRRVKPEHEAIVHLVGMALLFGLALLIGYQDIVRLFAK